MTTSQKIKSILAIFGTIAFSCWNIYFLDSLNIFFALPLLFKLDLLIGMFCAIPITFSLQLWLYGIPFNEFIEEIE